MLRRKADLRTFVWLLIIVLLFFVQWQLETLNGWLYISYLYFSFSITVIIHNHTHVRMWKPKYLNMLTDVVLTIFYGFPIIGWIPVHNQNHHKYINKRPDYNHTWRHWEENRLLALITYPAVSLYYQSQPLNDYYKHIYHKNKPKFVSMVAQSVCLIIWIAGALLIDWQKALLFVILPHQVALNSILLINYIQHVHADEEDDWNHSRNFTGRLFNFFTFNNGYHTVHHIKPGLHWSLAQAEHAQIAHHINPELNEPSFLWYLLRVYLLAPLFPALGTNSLRLERLNTSANK